MRALLIKLLLHRGDRAAELILEPGNALNRRVDVENYLMKVATGERPVPTREQFRTLALYLGAPRKTSSLKELDRVLSNE